jgi:hypothetical protein
MLRHCVRIDSRKNAISRTCEIARYGREMENWSEIPIQFVDRHALLLDAPVDRKGDGLRPLFNFLIGTMRLPSRFMHMPGHCSELRETNRDEELFALLVYKGGMANQHVRLKDHIWPTFRGNASPAGFIERTQIFQFDNGMGRQIDNERQIARISQTADPRIQSILA